MSSRNIAASSLWQLFSQAISLVFGLLSVKFVTTLLSQSLVGNYQTVYSFLQIFGILADFGLYAVAVREMSRTEKPHETLGTLFLLRTVITCLSLCSALLIAWVLPSFAGTPLPIGISIAAFVPFFTLLAGMLRTVFQVHHRMQYVFLAEVSGKFVPVCLLGIAVFLGIRQSQNTNLYYLFLSFGGVGAFTLLTLSVYFSKGLLPVHPAFSALEFRRLLRLALPFGLAYLATTLYRQSDVTLIAMLRDDYDIQNAYYGVVLRLTEVGYLLPTFILNSSLPRMSKAEQLGEDVSEFLGKVLLVLLTLGAIVSLFSFFWARPLMLLLTRASYLSTPLSYGSDTALQLMSFSMFLSFIVSYCFYLLLNVHKWLPLLISTSLAAALSIVLNLQMIPLLGFVGAGITSIIVHLFLATLLSVFMKQATGVRLRFSRFVRLFAYSSTLGLLLFLSAPLLQSSLITLCASIVGLPLAVLLLIPFGVFPPKFLHILAL